VGKVGESHGTELHPINKDAHDQEKQGLLDAPQQHSKKIQEV
jgi:hypothetical protein